MNYKVKLVNPEVQVTEKFKKREIILESIEQYPNVLQFQAIQDRCSLLDGIAAGDEVTLTYTLQGRKWKNPQDEIKYFTSLNILSIQKVGGVPNM